MSKTVNHQWAKAPQFAPVNECIYCGETQGLSDEHIIPLALNGTLILPKASCKHCAKLTSAIERTVARGFMYDARVVGNFRSRRKKLRPETLRTRFLTREHGVVEQELPLNEAAALLVLPTLARASVLDSQSLVSGVNVVGVQAIRFGKDIPALVRDRNFSGIEFAPRINANAFVQMLAKIAYGYCVATHGLFSREQTPLLRLIRGEADDGSSWVGSNDYKLQIEERNPRHALGGYYLPDAEQSERVVIRVKLFSNAGATGYEVATRVPGWQNYAPEQSGGL